MLIRNQVCLQPYLQYPQHTDKEVDDHANHTTTKKPVKIKQQKAGSASKLEGQNLELSAVKNEMLSLGTGVPTSLKFEHIEPTQLGHFDIKAVKFPEVSEQKLKVEQCQANEPLIRNLNLPPKDLDVLAKVAQNRKERIKARR